MDQLIIIEGIPGSGKTTFAHQLAKKLTSYHQDVKLCVEGDLHPADMAWCALLTKEEYRKVCEQYPEYIQQMEENKAVWKDYVIIAYTKIDQIDEKLYTYFESKEVYDGRVSAELFCGVHESRWERFGQQATGIHIFECALMQNAVNELTLFQCESEENITTYISKLLDYVKRLNPIIIYLDVDSQAAIDRAAKERVDQNHNPEWANRVTDYVTNSPYGKLHGLCGIDGMYQYFKQRKQLELRMLDQLPAKTYRLSVDIGHQAETIDTFIDTLCKSLDENHLPV